jgi:bacterioferritin
MDRSKSIALLNQAVADEIQAVHQYMYFHFHLDDQGFTPLSMLFKRTAIEEMMHVERLAERILYLKGEVEMVPAGPVDKITEPKAMLKKAMEMEAGSVEDYNRSAQECAAALDSGTKQVFEGLVADEERHFDTWDKEMDKVERFGVNYLALQSFNAGGAPAEAQGGAQ